MNIARLYQPTILLALALLAIITMMILPMPAFMLDLGLMISFGLSILVFTNTLFISRPLDFSAFPTILLASLMLRLSLNVSSTKLIIGEGHNGPHAAGEVIEGFAMFVMGGSIYLGLVVFGVLLIVNFIVITKGAGRMAEVGARFALDGMPGRQLAIDSDMAAGAISHEEARERRKLEQEETTFFGSLDGASKFVKGDAIAGLLITALNLIMGLAIGVFAHDMPLGEAFETYAILTVGDGLVNQIPAVIISIAAALLLSKGGALGSTDVALLSQLGGFPGALATVAVLMAMLALMPGLPMAPFLLGAVALGAAAWSVSRRAAETAEEEEIEAKAAEAAPEKTMGDLLDLDEIHIEFAADLVPAVMDEAKGLGARITNMRNHLVGLYGVVIPDIRLTDDPSLPDGTYVVRIQGVEMARAQLRVGKALILLNDEAPLAPPGEDAAEPVYGAPARWIAEDAQEDAALAGFSVITPTEVVATHLLELIKDNFALLFSRRALRKLMDEFTGVSDSARAAANRRLMDEFIPDKVPVDLLHGVMRRLLDERVSVRNLPLILEAIAQAKQHAAGEDAIAEHVRARLGFQIVAENAEPDGALPMIQLDPAWETLFKEHSIESDGVEDIALPPGEFNRLAGSIAEKLSAAAKSGRMPVVATTSRRRRFLRTVLASKGIRNAVLSFDEIASNGKPSLVGMA